MINHPNNFLLLFFFLLISSTLYGQVPEVTFENTSEEVSKSGYFKLSWMIPSDLGSIENLEFELQQSEDQTFEISETIYQGPDLASFISGLPNGWYYYRVRCVDSNSGDHGSWSEVKLVEVKHHSLKLAFTLFTIGMIVFLLTVGIIIKGNRMATEKE